MLNPCSMRCFNLLFFILILISAITYAQDEELLILPNYNSEIYCFALTNNGQSIYYLAGQKLISFDLKQQKSISELDIAIEAQVISICTDDTIDQIFFGTKSGKLISVSKTTGKVSFEYAYNAGSVNSLALTSDKKYLLSGCENGMVYKHSLEDICISNEFYECNESITSIKVSQEKHLIVISSGDGTITLFKDQTFEWINKLNASNKWLRQIAFNERKERLVCVGDAGRIMEYNISSIEHIRLIADDRVSKNWLLGLDVDDSGNVECWGGLDHLLKVRTSFGNYSLNLKGPVLQSSFISKSEYKLHIACCVLGSGILIIPIEKMEYKSIYK